MYIVHVYTIVYNLLIDYLIFLHVTKILHNIRNMAQIENRFLVFYCLYYRKQGFFL